MLKDSSRRADHASPDGPLVLNPPDSLEIQPGDRIIVIAEDNDSYRSVVVEVGSLCPQVTAVVGIVSSKKRISAARDLRHPCRAQRLPRRRTSSLWGRFCKFTCRP